MNHASSNPETPDSGLTGERLDQLADKMEAGVRDAVRHSMAECLTLTLREELTRALTQFLGAAELSGRETTGASAAADPDRDASIASILDDSCFKLEQILVSMERATLEVMDLVERRLSVHDDMLALLGRCPDMGVRDNLKTMFDALHSDLMDVITSLSFQDLTGQRIKRVMGALAQAGNLVQGRPAESDRAPAKPVVPVPTAQAPAPSQDQVDALLDQLGQPSAAPSASSGKGATSPAPSPAPSPVPSQDQVDALLSQLGQPPAGPIASNESGETPSVSPQSQVDSLLSQLGM